MRAPRHTLAPVLASALVFAGCGARAPIAESKTTADQNTATATTATAHSSSSAGAAAASGGDAVSVDDARASDPRAAAPLPADSPSTKPSGAPRAETTPPSAADLPVVDEPLYFPGARTRPRGTAVEASLDDEIIATWNRGGLTAEPTTAKGKPAHAAPRVKVDVTDVRGDASEADMQRAARLKSYWPFRICYEQGLRRAQKLHGTIKLRLTLGPSGRPSGVQQLAIELGDPAVVSCVVKSALGLGLPAPSSGAPQITLDISLWPGDEPVSVKSALRGKNAAPANAQAMTEQLRAHLPEVRACYAAGVGRHDGLWGRLALALRVRADIVDEVNEVESRFPDAEVTECVRKAFLKAAVPSTDRELVIVYALRLGHAHDGRDARR